MSKVTLGGDRLGSGKKNQVELSDYKRSNQDLSHIFRTTMSPGTLVPFLSKVAAPGDTFEINLNPKVMTHPTVGPLFGSYKLQCDVFSIPWRLYISKLHNNPINIGLNMSNVKLPQLEFTAGTIIPEFGNIDTQQVNPSSLLHYLGISAFGNGKDHFTFRRKFNALSVLSYFDIFKNFYANKQLDTAYIIHSSQQNSRAIIEAYSYNAVVSGSYGEGSATVNDVDFTMAANIQYISGFGREQYLRIHGKNLYVDYLNLACSVDRGANTQPYEGKLLEFFDVTYETTDFIEFKLKIIPETVGTDFSFVLNNITITSLTNFNKLGIDLEEFPLENIDIMREKILQWNENYPFSFGNVNLNPNNITPYSKMFDVYYPGEEEENIPYMLSCSQAQEGLLLKCYQNDLFNNWLKTETLVGAGSIDELTRIDTSEGFFSLDQLRLANKVNMMLQRIAMSGGSYNDYIEASWNVNGRLNHETPKFEGGLFQEIVFNEVVNNSGTEQQPLGTIAGKGNNNTDQKGGHIVIHVNEPCYIMGIMSITPRIDYSQGNEFDMNFTTVDDLHKPQLDQIGFQDLLTDQMLAIDTEVDIDGTCTYKSVGKVPAWINYMTAVNKCHGNFALENNEMFMTLNRRYEYDTENMQFKDITTYIDPTKFNYVFAQTSLDSMNFWVQIAININKRSVMSNKIMPNL